MRFLPSAAAAQAAGYRACKRCHPAAVPGSPEWDLRADLTARAMRMISDGVVDRSGVDGLCQRLGYSRRQVERSLLAELGASPLALARAQRAHTARLLLAGSELPMADIAFASGFGSVRQFNDTLRQVYARTPTQLRRALQDVPHGSSTTLRVRLSHRRPIDTRHLLRALRTEAVPGVEVVTGHTYERTLRLPSGPAATRISIEAGHVDAELTLLDLRDTTAAVARCRQLLDLDADPVAVDAVLGADPQLASSVAAHPGRRVLRTVDPHELALRFVIGRGGDPAERVDRIRRLVEAIGDRCPIPHPDLSYLFPTPAALTGVDLRSVRLPDDVACTTLALARAIDGAAVDLSPGADRAQARAELSRVPGLLAEEVDIIAMRGLGDPDVWPPGTEDRPDCRPWRSYSAQHAPSVAP